MSKPRRRKIRVPAKDYQPTKAELEEPIKLNLNGMSFEQAVQRLMRPVEVTEANEGELRNGRGND